MEDLFEFDLSDIDVAAFESVVTPATEPHPNEEQTSSQAGVEDQISSNLGELNNSSHHHAEPPPIEQEQQQRQEPLPCKPCKILLIPINSTKFIPGFKNLIPLARTTSTLTMSSLKVPTPVPAPAPTPIPIPPTNSTNKIHSSSKANQIAAPPSHQSHHQIQAKITNEVPKKPCNCTKSQCLKLYCDCFANGEFCSGCNCKDCYNSLSREKERQKAISQCLERNPEAFRPKIGKAVKGAPEAIGRRHTKGCNCKRSGCLKNYCECYEAQILCSNLCKCYGCKNYQESFERKTLMQMASSLRPSNTNSSRNFINNEVIRASLICLLQSAQQAERDRVVANQIPNLIYKEMGTCLRMIVDSIVTDRRHR